MMAGGNLKTDEELFTLFRAEGDSRAFSALYDRHRSMVYNYLLKILKSPELAEDLAQDIFIKLWDKREELPPLLSVRAYLLTMAKNHAYNFLKRAGVDQNARAELLKFSPTEGNSLENALHYADYKRYLDNLLADLTPQSREVFRLCRQQGKTYDETAELLGISRHAVKKHMVRSMKIMSDAVQKDLGISLPVLLLFISNWSR